MHTTKNDTGETLKLIRRGRGLTREELADASGVGLVTVWRIEAGKTPHPREATRTKLASALGVNAALLDKERPSLDAAGLRPTLHSLKAILADLSYTIDEMEARIDEMEDSS